MAKSPGFWFFTGDWLKDPELRFCSLFARGLLVDLLCYMFEAKEQGYLSNADGAPRTDEQIVHAISGGGTQEKLAALKELEHSGVLSRDSRGVLYSRRIARLAEISKARSKAGSKGGSKPQAKAKQNEKQNRGVSVSVSDSVSDITLSHSPEWPECLQTQEFTDIWATWIRHRIQKQKPIGSIEQEQQLFELSRYPEQAVEMVRYSISRGSLNLITNGDHKQKPKQERNGRTKMPILGANDD